MDKNVLWALLLTLTAGISTGIGAVVMYITKRQGKKLLSYALGFSGGIMLYVSFVELLDTSKTYLSSYTNGNLISASAFFCGIWLIMLIDKFIPSPEAELAAATEQTSKKLYRSGTMTALAIAIHNFPEGLATFTSALDNISLGTAIAFAIAIHNIPEGFAVAIPIYYATGNRKKAFLVSFFSGLTEPLGAIAGYLFLSPFLGNFLYGIIFALIAGIMVYISLEELIPAAREYNKINSLTPGVLSGMAIMALSLVIF